MGGGGSVRRTLQPSDGEQALTAARECAEAGQIDPMIDVLRDDDRLDALAGILGQLVPARLEGVDLVALTATLSTPPVAAAPITDRARAHLVLSRTASCRAETATQSDQIRIVERLLADADDLGDAPTLRRALAAERLDVAVRTATEVDRTQELADQCSHAIETCPAEETRTAAVLRLVRARACAWLATDQTLPIARRDLSEAAGMFHALGDDLGRLRSLLMLGWGVLPQLGQMDRAIEGLKAAADLAPAGSPQRAEIGVYLAELQTLVAADSDAAATLDEVLGAAGIPDVTVGYAAWERASLAFEHRDHDQVRRWVAHARRFAGDWYAGRAGAAFCCCVAEWAAESGWPDAPGLLDRARQQVAEHGYPAQLLMAEACAAMASGHWDEAVDQLRGWLTQGSTGHDWRGVLRLAWAELQRGNRDLARDLTRQAVEIADAVGHPEVIAIREPRRWADLAELAAESAGAAGSDGSGGAGAAVELSVLGDVCVISGGGPVRVTGDKPRQLLVALAVLDRPLRVAEASELLWPGVAGTLGRQRLRNVLARVRGHGGPGVPGGLVVRDDDTIRLAAGIRTDVAAFSASAERLTRTGVHSAADADLARGLLARYGTGPRFEPDDLLPDAGPALARLHRLAVGVGWALAEHLADLGRITDAVTVAESLVRLDPWNPDPLLWAADRLREDGAVDQAERVARQAADLAICRSSGATP